MGFSILRSTCWRAGGRIRSWRRMMNTTTTTTTTTIKPSRVCPCLMLPPASAAYKLYSLATNKVQSFKKEEAPPPLAEGLVKQVGSSHGWVASFNLDNEHIYLSNPTTSRHLKLPDIRTLPECLFSPESRTVVEKIILSASPSAADSLAFMTLGVRGMAFCRPNRGGGAWTHAGGEFYDDFVFSSRRKRLFCLTSDCAIECWDLTDPDNNSPTIVRKDSVLDDDGEKEEEEEEEEEVGARVSRNLVLAEESDRLFLVVRRVWEGVGPDGCYVEDIYVGRDRDRGGYGDYPYQTFDIDVHEIDWERGKVNYMDGTLDGLAMFVGINHALALPAAEFPGLKADSVYFTNEQELMPLSDDWINYGGHDVGVFDYVNRSFYSVYYPTLASGIARLLPPPIWITPSPY